MPRVPRRIRPAVEPPGPPPEGDFFASNSARRYAGDVEPLRLPRALIQAALVPTRFVGLGLAPWTSYEAAIVSFLLVRGHTSRFEWTALRGGQMTVNKSLSFELDVHLSHISRAMARLKRKAFVEVGVNVKERQAVRLTQHLHDFAIEAQWRNVLRSTAPDTVPKMARSVGWQRLLEAADKLFGRGNVVPSRWEDRHAVISKLHAQYNIVGLFEGGATTML